MDNGTVLKADHVSKKYCRTIKHTMLYGATDLIKNFFGLDQHSENLREGEFWAVDDVSFGLKRGETLGLIGPNGSGKSSLLKMLNGIFMPDKGRIEINGRVGALIEVGAGFHPLLTGRENVSINGAILGLSQKEIDDRFNDIVDFAGLWEFIDSPVKHYSSGMRVRLGFSVAAHCEPDIFLVDEVLAVGDFKFRQKCAEKIHEIRKKAPVLLVSHSMRDITMLCNYVIVLNRGKAVYCGLPKDAIDVYLKIMAIEEKASKAQKKDMHAVAGSSYYSEMYHDKEKITDIQHRWVDGRGKPVEVIEHGGAIILEFSFRLLKPVERLIVGVPIWDGNGTMITAFNTDAQGFQISVLKNGVVKGRLKVVNIPFNPGIYNSVITILDGNKYLYRYLAGIFKVKEMAIYYGFVTPEHEWAFLDKENEQ